MNGRDDMIKPRAHPGRVNPGAGGEARRKRSELPTEVAYSVHEQVKSRGTSVTTPTSVQTIPTTLKTASWRLRLR